MKEHHNVQLNSVTYFQTVALATVAKASETTTVACVTAVNQDTGRKRAAKVGNKDITKHNLDKVTCVRHFVAVYLLTRFLILLYVGRNHSFNKS